MIKITKATEPDILSRNKAAWTTDYVAYVSRGERVPDAVSGRYRHEDIKSQLIAETYGKCAYCEAKMLHVSFGDIEHILPKESEPNLTFEWSNLTLACSRCNNGKGTYYSPESPLVNPYADNPSEHLRAYGPMIVALKSVRGDLTEKIIKLNRLDLLERRKERIEKMLPLIEIWSTATQPRKDILKVQILEEAKEDKEFSLVVKQFLEDSKIV